MTLRAIALLAAAVLTMGAAPPTQKAAPKPAAPKAPATAKPAAPAPAAAKPAAGPFDAQDPASLIALLATMDAKAETASKGEDAVLLKVVTPTFTFGVQYAGCDAQGRKCKAMAFTTVSTAFSPTLTQLNAFNQTSITCRVWQDKGGKPNVMYSALLSPQDTAEEAKMHVAAWQGCLASFGDFLKDPAAYLASAP